MLNEKGDICSGEFRADHMEGKLNYQKTLIPAETAKIFSLFIETNDIFIFVEKN